MKRILFACFLLTATCSMQHAQAQTATAVSVTTFTAKVNLLDSYIAAGDMAHATATWSDVHDMMLAELSYTKAGIASATTTTARAAAQAVNDNQGTIYHTAWGLKSNLTTNRSALHTALLNFASTF